MKMLPRTGPVVEPVNKEISGPAIENGRLVTRSVQITVEREVMLLTVETASQLARATPRAVYRWVESGEIHFHEDSSGTVFVCSESMKGLGEHRMKLVVGGDL